MPGPAGGRGSVLSAAFVILCALTVAAALVVGRGTATAPELGPPVRLESPSEQTSRVVDDAPSARLAADPRLAPPRPVQKQKLRRPVQESSGPATKPVESGHAPGAQTVPRPSPAAAGTDDGTEREDTDDDGDGAEEGSDDEGSDDDADDRADEEEDGGDDGTDGEDDDDHDDRH